MADDKQVATTLDEQIEAKIAPDGTQRQTLDVSRSGGVSEGEAILPPAQC